MPSTFRFSGVEDAQHRSDPPEQLAVYGCLILLAAADVAITVAVSNPA
jgi:hypothetical protein